jgi:two-component system, NtrC family, response regulator AtoC
MKVLVLDPDAISRDALRQGFAAAGAAVRVFSEAAEADRALPDFQPEVLVAALDAPGAADLVARARTDGSGRIVYALVDREDLDRGVSSGAHDFLWRPVSAARVAQLHAGAEDRRLRGVEAEAARVRLARAELRDTLPGRSPRWLAALGSLERAAASNASVLLTGECGTEKDVAALALHGLSRRGAGRFAYISEGESLELAVRQTGAGTLFLPNVETTSTAFQDALLAQIALGGPTRFVLGIDEDPREALEAGRLSRALRSALADEVVHLPPLREREGDVALLARRALEEIDPDLLLDAEALDALQAHDWPGNVRELKETLRRAARLSEDSIGPTVLRSVLARPLPRTRARRRKPPVVRIAVGDSLADVERRLISKTLEFARGNKKKTAELLKLSLKTIYNKIKEYGLEH